MRVSAWRYLEERRPKQDAHLHVVVRVELGGADLPSDLLQPVADDIGSPLVVSEESLQAESLKTVRKP